MFSVYVGNDLKGFDYERMDEAIDHMVSRKTTKSVLMKDTIVIAISSPLEGLVILEDDAPVV